MADDHSAVTDGRANSNQKSNKKKKKRKKGSVTIIAETTELGAPQPAADSDAVPVDSNMNGDAEPATDTNTPPSKKCKVDEGDVVDSKYKVENYITEQQINDIISNSEMQNSCESERQTCSVFELNKTNTVSHNIIVNPESGEVESIVRREFDKSTTPQCFYISSPPASLLDIIEEESNSGSETGSRCSIGTQTDWHEEKKQYLLNGYPLQCSNLSVRCSSDSISDWSDSSVGSSGVPGFRDRYREVIYSLRPSSARSSSSRSRHNRNHDVLKLVPSRNDSFTKSLSQSSVASSRPLSAGQSNAEKNAFDSTSSTSLSNYMNLGSTSSMDSVSDHRRQRLEACRRSYQEEMRALRELCGLPTTPSRRYTIDGDQIDINNNGWSASTSNPNGVKIGGSSSTDLSRRSMITTRTSSLNWRSSEKLVSALKSSSSMYGSNASYGSSTFSNRNSSLNRADRGEFVGRNPLKINSWNSLTSNQSRPYCRPAAFSTTSTDWSDSWSTSSTRTRSNPQRRPGFAMLRSAPPRNRYSTTTTSSELSDLSWGKSQTSSDDVTSSLNELSRKFDVYLKNAERQDGSAHKDSSSDTGTDSTVRYIPEIVTSDCNETDYAYPKQDQADVNKVPTLKKLALMVVLSFKNGVDLLSDIYFIPPQKATHLNKLYTTKTTGCCQCRHEHVPRCIPRIPHEPWTEVQIPGCPTRVLLSPSQAKSLSSPETVDFAAILDNHQKFRERRGYYEHRRNETFRTDVITIEGIYSPKTPKSCIFNVDENYTKELLEEAANLLAVRKYRETRFRGDERKPTSSSGRERPLQKRNLICEQSTPLELIQNEKQFRTTDTIDQIGNNVLASRAPETKINTRSSSTSDVVSSATATVASSATVTSSATRETSSTGRVSVRPRSLPATNDEDGRQRMYAEYMRKVAERFERRQKKMIRITRQPVDAPTMVKIFHNEVAQERPCSLEEEFMQKARTRMQKLGISLEEQTCEGYGQMEEKKVELPNHLQEFMQIVGDQDEGEFECATNPVCRSFNTCE